MPTKNHCSISVCRLGTYFFYFFGVTLSYAADELIHPEVGFLVLAPDRRSLGNEKVRKLLDDFSKECRRTLVCHR